MLSSKSGQGNSSCCFNSTHHNTKRNCFHAMISSSPSPSSSSSSKSASTSSSSSASPFSPANNFRHHHPAAAPTPKTMEEVWKDINLASLHDHPCEQDLSASTPTLHSNPPHHPNSNFILQDFFARPFCKDPPTRIVSGSRGDSTTTGLYSSPAPPPPATVLSLNTGPVFDFVHISDPLRTSSHLRSHYPVSNISSFNSDFDALGSSPGLASFGRKRVQESDGSSGDRRQKRMIKNRESAARSRARKQERNSLSLSLFIAYTNELELEVTHLLEENARLRRQQEELYMAAAVQLPKKRSLHRSSTAPF